MVKSIEGREKAEKTVTGIMDSRRRRSKRGRPVVNEKAEMEKKGIITPSV